MSFSFVEVLEEFCEAANIVPPKSFDQCVVRSVILCRERWKRSHHSHMSKPGNRERKARKMREYRLRIKRGKQ